MKLLIDSEGTSIKSNGPQLTVETRCNTIELETFKGKLKLYERGGELEIAREGIVIWSSYSTDGDTWKDWGPDTKKAQSK